MLLWPQVLFKFQLFIFRWWFVGNRQKYGKLTGHEKVFYFDQQTTRECRLSEEIGLKYEKQQQSIQENKLKGKQQEQSEHDFIMQDDEQEEQEETPSDNEATEFLNSSVNTSNISINRSGHARIQYTGVDVAVQTEYVSDRPKLRINKRGCTNEIKLACARISSVCCISNEISRKAV